MKDQDTHKKEFDNVCKELSRIKKKLGKVSDWEELQQLIATYEKTSSSEYVTLYIQENPEAELDWKQRSSKVNDSVVNALKKQLKAMLHILKHDVDAQTLETIAQHIQSFDTKSKTIENCIADHKRTRERLYRWFNDVVAAIEHKKNAVVSPPQPEKEIIEQPEVEQKHEMHQAEALLPEPPVSEITQNNSLPSHKSEEIEQKFEVPHAEVSVPKPSASQTIQSKPIPSREVRLSQFHILLKQLEIKRDDFHRRYPEDTNKDLKKPFGALSQLITSIDGLGKQYLYGTIELKAFKEQTSQLIRGERKGVLSQHRGVKELLANLFLFISTLGLGYAVAALWTQSKTPIKLKTDTVEQLDTIEQSIQVMTA